MLSSLWGSHSDYTQKTHQCLDILPKDVIAGRDPQLEKAVELVMKELEKNPPKIDQRPAYPRRAAKKDGN